MPVLLFCNMSLGVFCKDFGLERGTWSFFGAAQPAFTAHSAFAIFARRFVLDVVGCSVCVFRCFHMFETYVFVWSSTPRHRCPTAFYNACGILWRNITDGNNIIKASHINIIVKRDVRCSFKCGG